MTQIYVTPLQVIGAGRITIPSHIRKDLDIELGSIVYVAVSKEPMVLSNNDKIQQ